MEFEEERLAGIERLERDVGAGLPEVDLGVLGRLWLPTLARQLRAESNLKQSVRGKAWRHM